MRFLLLASVIGTLVSAAPSILKRDGGMGKVGFYDHQGGIRYLHCTDDGSYYLTKNVYNATTMVMGTSKSGSGLQIAVVHPAARNKQFLGVIGHGQGGKPYPVKPSLPGSSFFLNTAAPDKFGPQVAAGGRVSNKDYHYIAESNIWSYNSSTKYLTPYWTNADGTRHELFTYFQLRSKQPTVFLTANLTSAHIAEGPVGWLGAAWFPTARGL